MNTEALFQELHQLTDAAIDVVSKKVSKLSETQLTWSPNKETWSLLEIFAHLNAYSSFYHPAFLNKIEATKFRDPRENFISSPLGKSAWKMMKLGNAKNIKRKFRAPKLYNPKIVASLVKPTAVDDFIHFQGEFKEILDKAKAINIRKAKIGISISKIIRLRFGDALLFVAYHNERHVQQAMNLINHRAFPAK
jgi:hypothetical protein